MFEYMLLGYMVGAVVSAGAGEIIHYFIYGEF